MLQTQIWNSILHSPADLAANGQQPAPAAPLDPEEAKRRAAFSRQISASFGEIVSVLMRSPSHKFHSLSDLEWLVIPAVVTGQFRVAEAASKENGFTAPVAVVLWASVSAEVDQRLAQSLEQPMRLKPNEWRSGNIVWLVEAVGDNRAVMAVLQRLKQHELKDQMVRMRIRGKDGKPAIGRLELQPAGAPPAPATA